MSDWKARLGVVYSTNPDYNYDNGEAEEVATLPKQQQKLRVWRDTHGRGGKVAPLMPISEMSWSPTRMTMPPGSMPAASAGPP